MPTTYMIDGKRVTKRQFQDRTRKPRGKDRNDRYIDGCRVSKNEYWRRTAKRSPVFGAAMASATWMKPIASETAAVHPSQIEEAKAFNAERGVSVPYTADGRPIFRDRATRRNYLKAWQMHDKSGGYGD